MTLYTDYGHSAEADVPRHRRLLFSQYPSLEVLADMRATLADGNQLQALWRSQFALDEPTSQSILEQMERDWSALWYRFGYEVDCLACVPGDRTQSLESLLHRHPGLTEALHDFEEKWAKFIPARLTRTAS